MHTCGHTWCFNISDYLLEETNRELVKHRKETNHLFSERKLR
jgi:hypothetical protein